MNNYEKLNLYPHNIESYQKVKQAFDNGEKTVSIIHATGTGKSYNALSLALDHKEKNIVWIVPSNAIKEHIEKTINDNPNLNIEHDFPNLEIITYQNLIYKHREEIKEIPCDLLIVDEIHHLGAPVWGERVKTFIDTHENIKKFGITAYTIRDRGTVYERDVTNPETDEIFSDSIASVYDLYDAMIDGILPKPICRSVVTENSEYIIEIKEKIELLKRKGDPSYKEYKQIINDVVKMIHQQNGIKELIQQTVKPDGKYIYFCPVSPAEGQNDIETIQEETMKYLREKYPNKKIVFYKSTSADKEVGKYNRDCFYNDIDLDGNDVSDTIRIMFAKNQYNEGVHAPNVDGVFLGRRTKSDIVAFEQIGRALSVRGNTTEKIEEYNKYSFEELKQLVISRGLLIEATDTKETLIEKLISPIIIDLADNIEFIEELETNLGNRVKEIQEKGPGNKRIVKIINTKVDIQIINKDLLNILKNLREKLRNKTWDDMYELAKAYYDHHGNSEVPNRFKTKNGYEYDEEGVTLGAWCGTQRRNKDNLGTERINKLKLIEFRFETKNLEQEWNRMYELAKAYYDHHGNSEVPNRFKTKNGYEYDEEGVTLGQWCATQRRNKDNLGTERINKLKLIEFRFETNKFEQEWNRMYELAKAYYDYHGNSEVPYRFKTKNGYEYDDEGETLGAWCVNQRRNKDNLGTERINKLKLIEFRFENKRMILPWDDMYELAKTYYDYHGNSEVPSSFKTKNGYEYDEEGVRLGQWCATQRSNKDNLGTERINKLKLIEFRFENKIMILPWDDMYELAKAYYDYHGNSEVPSSFKTKNGYEYDEEGVRLGRWCTTQRSNKDNLGTEGINKLKLIEFRFETNKFEQEWNRMYELAKAYYDYHGNSEVPSRFKTKNGYEYDEEGVALGRWCTIQRSNTDNLGTEGINKLKLIEFRFETNKYEQEWNRMYELAKAYYDYHGNSEVPSSFKTKNGYEYDEEGVRLGQWCGSQRRRQEKLSEEQINKLNLIEFRFNTKKEHKDNIIELCNQYNLDIKKYKFLTKMSYQELYAKIAFILDNNYELEFNGELNPIFEMSNINMQIQYGISKEELITKYYIDKKKRGA